MTFDVEDWYQSTVDKTAQIRDVVIKQTWKVLTMLEDAGVRATFFILGLVAEAFPDLIKRIHLLGHEIGTHGYAHELVFLQTPSAFAADLNRSMKLLEDLTGSRIVGYRAPDFSITSRSLWALDVLEESGIMYDSSIFPIRNRRYGIPGCQRRFHYVRESTRPPFPKGEIRSDGPSGASSLSANGGSPANSSLIEFPLSTVRVLGINLPVCGGGYFRLLPYSIIRSAVTRINNEKMPAMIYMHPYEFDSQDLASPLSDSEDLSLKLLRITQNVNRTRSEAKLRNLLRDFIFAPAAEVLKIDG